MDHKKTSAAVASVLFAVLAIFACLVLLDGIAPTEASFDTTNGSQGQRASWPSPPRSALLSDADISTDSPLNPQLAGNRPPQASTSKASISSSTVVSGYINTDTTWTQAESPYLVVDDVIVSSGVELTIEPGTEVQFDGNYQLWMQGSLSALGTESTPITFTHASSGNWDIYPKSWTQGYCENLTSSGQVDYDLKSRKRRITKCLNDTHRSSSSRWSWKS